MRWVNLRGGNIDQRKPQICYVCKTSYPSEEAMRNHARRAHKGHKQVETREAKSKNERFASEARKALKFGKEE